jgi:hypothetical protein
MMLDGFTCIRAYYSVGHFKHGDYLYSLGGVFYVLMADPVGRENT